MRKILVLSALALLFSVTACYAQDSAYGELVKKIVSQASSLEAFTRQGAVDFTSYEAWLKKVKVLSDTLIKDFSRGNDKKASYQFIQQGLSGLNEIWNALKQAQYADGEYKESITAGDIGYAHKWKASAVEQRKKALELIPASLEYFKKAKDALGSE